MTDIQLALYAGYLAAAYDGATVWDASTDLTLTLHTSGYTPDRVGDTSVADLTDELPTADGYTAGGVTLTGATTTVTAANAWAQQWAAGTDYQLGQLRRPTVGNGFVYRVSVAGTSGGAEPVWPTTVGECVTDGTVEWTCAGIAVVALDAADLTPAWSTFAAGPFRHLVLSDRAEALPANQPLVGVFTFGADQTGGGGDFDVVFDPGGIVTTAVP